MITFNKKILGRYPAVITLDKDIFGRYPVVVTLNKEIFGQYYSCVADYVAMVTLDKEILGYHVMKRISRRDNQTSGDIGTISYPESVVMM